MEEGKKNCECLFFLLESFIYIVFVVNFIKLYFIVLDERKFYKILFFIFKYYFFVYVFVLRRNRKKLKENEVVFVGYVMFKNIVI